MVNFIKRNKKICFVILCIFAVLVMYGSSLWGDFVYDDRTIVAHQGFLENPLNWSQVLVTPYWNIESGAYRPTTVFSYGLNYFIFGSGAISFHFVNILLYLLSGYFLFLLIKRLFPKRELLAYLSTFLFLILPIHTEVVANIVGRAEILALLFSILGLLELLKRAPNKWLITLWFLLAMGSKETAVAILPVAFLIVWHKKKNFKKILTKNVLENLWFPSILSVFTYFSIRFWVLGQHFFTNTATLVENSLKFVSFPERIFTSLKILSLYITKTVLPFNLCSDYSFNQIPIEKSFFSPDVMFGFLVLTSSVFGIFYFFKKKFEISLALTFFLFPFLIISNLLTPIGTIMGERLFYFSSVGFVILIASFIVFAKDNINSQIIKRCGFIILILISTFYVVRSFDRSLDWMTEEKLFISAGKCASQSVLSLSNLATVHYFKEEYEKAEEIILDSYEIYDGYTKANNNLGLIYWKTNRLEEAKEQYLKTFLNYPPYEGVYENLVLFYLSQDNREEAEKWMKIGQIFIRSAGSGISHTER